MLCPDPSHSPSLLVSMCSEEALQKAKFPDKLPSEKSSYQGVAEMRSAWEATYQGIYLGLYESEEEAALAHDQALLLDLGRFVQEASPLGKGG